MTVSVPPVAVRTLPVPPMKIIWSPALAVIRVLLTVSTGRALSGAIVTLGMVLPVAPFAAVPLAVAVRRRAGGAVGPRWSPAVGRGGCDGERPCPSAPPWSQTSIVTRPPLLPAA